MNKKNIRNRLINLGCKSRIKTIIKRLKKSIDSKNIELSKKEFINMQSFIDKQARKNIIHKNKSSRLKSRFMKIINTM